MTTLAITVLVIWVVFMAVVKFAKNSHDAEIGGAVILFAGMAASSALAVVTLAS